MEYHTEVYYGMQDKNSRCNKLSKNCRGDVGWELIMLSMYLSDVNDLERGQTHGGHFEHQL